MSHIPHATLQEGNLEVSNDRQGAVEAVGGQRNCGMGMARGAYRVNTFLKPIKLMTTTKDLLQATSSDNSVGLCYLSPDEQSLKKVTCLNC